MKSKCVHYPQANKLCFKLEDFFLSQEFYHRRLNSMRTMEFNGNNSQKIETLYQLIRIVVNNTNTYSYLIQRRN